MNKLYTYALASTIYNEKGDYIDCFLPFVLSVIISKISNTEKELQERIKETFNLEIPSHSLKSVLTRGIRKDYIQGNNGRYFLTDKGIKFNEAISHRDTKQEINNFMGQLTKYLKQSGCDIREIEEIFQHYINSNLKSLFFFIDAGAYDLDGNIQGQHVLFPHITRFVNHIENSEKDLFAIFQNMIFGKIMLLAISGATDISELQENFKDTTLILDTNVVFDILGFQGEEAARVTDEFFQLTQKNKKFVFYVFDFTIDEIVRVLVCFPSQALKYLSDIRVDSIYYHLKAKGWKNSDVNHFIQNVEQELSKKNIKILRTTKFSQSKEVEDKINKLTQYKPDRTYSSYKHDLRAIIEIERLRCNKVTRFERSGYFFLTQDTKLAKFNYSEYEHKQYQSVPEVILEQALTNLLWLKMPKDIPLNALISFHKKYAVVDENVWRLFYDKILHAKENDIDFYKDTTTLLCHNQLQSTLANIDSDATAEDIESIVKAEAKVARLKEEKEKNALLEKQRIEIEKQFDTRLEKTKEDNIKQISDIRDKKIEALIQYREQLQSEAMKTSKRIWYAIKILLTILLVGLYVYSIPAICSYWQKLEPRVCFIGIIIPFICGIWGLNFINLFTNLKIKLDIFCEKRKFKNRHFQELLQGLEINIDELKMPLTNVESKK